MCQISLDELSNDKYNRYLNDYGIIEAISNAIELMKKHMRNRRLLDTREYLRDHEHNEEFKHFIRKMNEEELTALGTQDPLVASAFLKQYLDGMKTSLLPKSICELHQEQLTPMGIVATLLADPVLSDRHFRFFVYIFKFLQRYWRYPAKPSALIKDAENEPNITIDEMATLMAPCITHSEKPEKKTARRQMRNSVIKIVKYANAFQYVLENLDEILGALAVKMPDVVNLKKTTYL